MNFELPDITDYGSDVPEFSEAECAAAPSTSLMSLANSLGGSLSQIAEQAQSLQSRYDKIKGEISAFTSGDGKSVIDTIQSISKVGTSIQESIGPIQSTVSVFGDISDTLEPVLTNTEEAGTTEDDIEGFASKISGYYDTLGGYV